MYTKISIAYTQILLLLLLLTWFFPLVSICLLWYVWRNIIVICDVDKTLPPRYELCIKDMAAENVQNNKASSTVTPNPAATSCRKKKSEQASFLEDIKDHMDEFIHASMDEHKTCFKKTIQKMFGMSKVVAERNAEAKEVESSLPLQTTLAK